MIRRAGFFLLLGLVTAPLWAQTPSGTIEVDGSPLPGAGFFRQNGNVYLPVDAVGKRVGAVESMDPTGRFLTWNGRILAIHAVTVAGVTYAPWFDLQPLLGGLQLDVKGDTVSLHKAGARPTTGPAATADMKGAQVVQELSLARTSPQTYVHYLEDRRKWYVAEHIYNVPGLGARRCKEGIKALEDAIAFLHAQAPLPPLSYSPGLSHAAADVVDITGKAGVYGNGGVNHVAQYGEVGGAYTEEINYGFADPRFIVIDMIVDDGDPGRSHRADIFNPAFGTAGAAVGFHRAVDVMTCIEFAGAYQEKP